MLRAVKRHPGLELKLVAAASALLDRYGTTVDLIERDGFTVDARVHMLVEGETPHTMAKSTGLGLMELPTVFDLLKPDIVITVGDRFETIATAIAAAYMNIPLAHTMGGEVSGTIDESIRHAITKFAQLHFPASRDAAERIKRLGEPEDRIFMVGCPRIDLVSEVLKREVGNETATHLAGGVGSTIDLEKPFVLVSQHPVTTEYGHGEAHITNTLEAIRKLGIQAIVLWPNADAGSEHIARGIRKWREHGLGDGMHFGKNFPTEVYIDLMRRCAALVGNSSSGIREGAFIGTPVVNIGSRQNRRERGSNVIDVGYDTEEIYSGLKKQIEHGHYPAESIYGDGQAGTRIAEILANCNDISVQKTITY